MPLPATMHVNNGGAGLLKELARAFVVPRALQHPNEVFMHGHRAAHQQAELFRRWRGKSTGAQMVAGNASLQPRSIRRGVLMSRSRACMSRHYRSHMCRKWMLSQPCGHCTIPHDDQGERHYAHMLSANAPKASYQSEPTHLSRKNMADAESAARPLLQFSQVLAQQSILLGLVAVYKGN